MAAVGGPVPPAVHEPATARRWLGKPGPAYPGFPAQGASALAGGRACLGLSPTGRRPPRKGSRNPRGVKLRKNGEGHGSRGGEGTPRRDPGGPAGRSRPNGRVGGHQTATATAATAYLWRRGPAYRTSHGRPQAQMGRGARGSPRDGPGETGAGLRSPTASCGRSRGRRPNGSAVPLAVWIRGEWSLGFGARSPRGEKPPSWVRPPAAQPPGPTGPGALFLRGPTFAKVHLRAGEGPKGPERGPARIDLRRIPGDPRINPARGGGGREASRGWDVMQEPTTP